jgi:hypothetical protein
MKLFANGQMPLRMVEKRQMMPLTVQPQQQQWMNATSEICR